MVLCCGVTLFEHVDTYSAEVGPAGTVVAGAVVTGTVVAGAVVTGTVVAGTVVAGTVVVGPPDATVVVVAPATVVVVAATVVVVGAATVTDAMGDTAPGENTAGDGPPEPAQQKKLALIALLTRHAESSVQ
jgi:hypothetical protein